MNPITPTTIEAAPAVAVPGKKDFAARRQIRGSSLLLLGQLLAKGVNFGIQVMIVRYLSRSDYGAFAYGLSIVALGESIATFGLDRAITRYVPIYHEQHDYNKMFGTLFMVVVLIASLGLTMALFLRGAPGLVGSALGSEPRAFSLLLILIFLSPVQALDGVLVGLFAVFASSRSIFFRKYVLGPGLKLGVVVLLILLHSDVYFLAGGYLAATTLAVAIYTAILVRVMRAQGMFEHFNWKTIDVPWREVLSFTLPLLTSDILYAVMNTMDAVVLERSRGSVDVAALRAVDPTAVLNSLVISSFTVLFTPMAARMFARNDREGINNLYWQTAIWMAVMTFPIFALTFSLAQPITLLLYGSRYAQSAIILALLSLGYYFDAALGFNGLTLKVYGKVRYSVVINVLAGVFNLGAILVLIPRYGAVGAAIGTCSALIVHNILKQAGLRLGTGINLFEWRYFRVYLVIVLCAGGLLLFHAFISVPVYVSLALAALASAVVIGVNRKLLKIGQIFPEIQRLPFARRLFGE
jgi:O-antigen/teichoic acid export membrane protein